MTELRRSVATPHGVFFLWRDSSVMACVGLSARRWPDHIGGAGLCRKRAQKGAKGRKRARFEVVSSADLLRQQYFRGWTHKHSALFGAAQRSGPAARLAMTRLSAYLLGTAR
jgi:hypothetical protein